MQIAALHRAKMAGELAALQVVVSSASEFMFGCSPDEILWVEVVEELIAEFQKKQERRSRLERLGTRIYDLILGPPSGRARLANRLEGAIRRLGWSMLHDEKWTLSWRPYGLGCPSLRLGAGRGQRVVFFGGVTVHGSGR
jgi:hypothetical protein